MRLGTGEWNWPRQIMPDDGLSKKQLSQIWVERRADEALALFQALQSRH